MELQFIAVIAALFAAGGLVIAAAAVFGRGRDTAQLWRLYGTEFAIVGAVMVASSHPIALFVGVTVLGLRAQYEFEELHAIATPRGRLAVDLALGALVVAVGTAIGQVWLLAAVGVVIAATVGYLASPRGARNRVALVAAAGIVFPVIPIAHLGLVGSLPDGLAWILFLFIVVETNDAFALVFGKLFGKTPILPNLSPGKTLEGTVMGVLCGGAVGVVLAVMAFELPSGMALAVVALILFASLAGDAATSAIKRRVGRKDFAALHVLHGGALDIYDSFIFVAPFLYAFHWAFLS